MLDDDYSIYMKKDLILCMQMIEYYKDKINNLIIPHFGGTELNDLYQKQINVLVSKQQEIRIEINSRDLKKKVNKKKIIMMIYYHHCQLLIVIMIMKRYIVIVSNNNDYKNDEYYKKILSLTNKKNKLFFFFF